ncbi:MAG TPA: hypothetical protein VN634_11290 [Candidatus Limnocylindrales bacterium]|nr:hypothetical protein [Candidatus Limnocylindrales bacterium]
MPGIRTFAIVCATSLVAMIAMGPITALIGISLESGRPQLVGIAILFTLFVVFGLSAVALMVKLVLSAHVAAGNADSPLVRALRNHETGVIVAFWSLIVVGLALAVPAAILDGAMGPEPARRLHEWLPPATRRTSGNDRPADSRVTASARRMSA